MGILFLEKYITCRSAVFEKKWLTILSERNYHTLKTHHLVKYFIDGQNFHNRLRDFGIEIDQIDYQRFFDHIMAQIRRHHSDPAESHVLEDLPLQFLKAEWFSVGHTFIDYYPYKTMKVKHLTKHVKNKKSGLWKKILKYPTNHDRFPKRYRKIFEHEYAIDKLVAAKAIENVESTHKLLLDLEEKYKGKGSSYNGDQLDLIYMKFCGFLKIKYETRTWMEKGVDPAIACQMIASKLSTTLEQKYDDALDIIPNYNSDIIVLISSDMDYVEAFKILHTMKVPCYMIHLTNKLPKDLNGNHPYCTHLVINDSEMKNFVL